MTKNKNKTTKRGGSRLIGPVSRALGALTRNSARNSNTMRQSFTTAINAGTDRNALSGVHSTEFEKKKQPIIHLDVGNIPVVYHGDDAGNRITPTRDSRDSIRGRSKIDVGSTMMPTSSATTKIAIVTLITAFLSVLIGKTEIGAEIKSDTNVLVKKATDDIYDYMVARASQRLKAGDTTIIASMYKTITKHMTSEDRKKMFKKLVIDGVSYEWLAEYDHIIDIWLNKIIQLEGNKLPSDKYIINLVNTIQNKVLPITNAIWYYKRAVKRGLSKLGIVSLSKADSASDDYWYTSEGQSETAIGARQMLEEEDTVLAKIIVGILSSGVISDEGLIKTIIGDIKPMLRELISKLKRVIDNDLHGFRQTSEFTPLNPTGKSANDDIQTYIRQLKELEKEKVSQPYRFKELKPKHRTKQPIDAVTIDPLSKLRDMGAFGWTHGGKSRKRRRGCTQRSYKACRRRRTTVRKNCKCNQINKSNQ
jgi:hypothetical protein